jgi:hypothetical protein
VPGGVDHHRDLALRRVLTVRHVLGHVLPIAVSPCGMAHSMTATAFPGLFRGYIGSLLLLYKVSVGMAH